MWALKKLKYIAKYIKIYFCFKKMSTNNLLKQTISQKDVSRV